LNEEIILPLPPGVTCYVVAKFKAQQQLQRLDWTVLNSEIAGHEGASQLSPGSALAGRIHHRVVVIGQAGAEVYHRRFY
jgi:hypothetical protein